MKILVAAPRGFCAGVDMALRVLDVILDREAPPVYCFHQIVHNRHVVAGYEEQGVVFVDDIDQVPPGSLTVFSAHGVAPSVRRRAAERSLRVVDATCPLVSKVHAEVRRFAAQELPIVLVGHRGHDETVGVLGEAPSSIRLVESVEDVARLPEGSAAAYVTQTTLSVDDTTEIVEELEARFPVIQGPARDDICYATQNRQAAVRRFAPEADVVLVVGSGNSSNSRRLVEVAESRGTSAHLVDGVADLIESWFDDDSTVLLTAGASAPEELVQAVVDWLSQRFPVAVETRALPEVEESLEFRLPPEVRG